MFAFEIRGRGDSAAGMGGEGGGRRRGEGFGGGVEWGGLVEGNREGAAREEAVS